MKKTRLFAALGVFLGLVFSTGAALVATHSFENRSVAKTSAATLDTMVMQFKDTQVVAKDPANCSFSVGTGTSSATSSFVNWTLASDGVYTEGSNQYPAYKYTMEESSANSQFIYSTVVVRLSVTVQPWEHTRVRILFNPIKTVMTDGGNADHAVELAADDTLHNVYNTAPNFSNFVYNQEDYTTKSTGDDVLARTGRRAAGENATACEYSWYIQNNNQTANTYWIYFAVSGYVESTKQTPHTTTQSVRFGVNIRETGQYACRIAYNNTEYYFDTLKACINYINTLPSTTSKYSIVMLRNSTESSGGIIVKRNIYINLNGYTLTKGDAGSATYAFFLAREQNGLDQNITIELHHGDSAGTSNSTITGPCNDAVFLLGDDGDQYTVTLKVYSNVIIHNTASGGRSVVVHQSGILYAYQGSELKANTTVAGLTVYGKAYLSGNITVPNGDSIFVQNSEKNSSGTTVVPSLYLYYNPTITHGSSKHTISIAGGGPSTVNLYASDGTSQYLSNSASNISILYLTTPTTSGVTIVREVNSQVVANKFSIAGLSSTLLLGYNSSTKILSTVNARTVNFNANGGSGTISSRTVQQGSTISLPTCTFTAPAYYHFGYWCLNYNGSGTHYNENATYTVNGNVTFYAIWEQTTYEKVEQFIDTYMHMDENNNGQCVTLFEPAKNAFNVLDVDARDMFAVSGTVTKIKNARARLNAWAAYHGFALDGNNQYVQQNAGANRTLGADTNNSVAAIIAVSATIITISLLGFFLTKKKYSK